MHLREKRHIRTSTQFGTEFGAPAGLMDPEAEIDTFACWLWLKPPTNEEARFRRGASQGMAQSHSIRSPAWRSQKPSSRRLLTILTVFPPRSSYRSRPWTSRASMSSRMAGHRRPIDEAAAELPSKNRRATSLTVSSSETCRLTGRGSGEGPVGFRSHSDELITLVADCATAHPKERWLSGQKWVMRFFRPSGCSVRAQVADG